MRIILRFIIPLIIALSVTAFAALPFLQKSIERWHIRDLEIRSDLIAKSLDLSLRQTLFEGKESWNTKITQVQRTFDSIIQDERLAALVICGSGFSPAISKTAQIDAAQICRDTELGNHQLKLGKVAYHVTMTTIEYEGAPAFRLAIIHDLSFATVRGMRVQRYLIGFAIILGLIVCIITALIARLSYRSWFDSVLGILRGEGPAPRSFEALRLKREVNHLVRELERSRSLKEEGTQTWTPASLREILKNDLTGDEVLIVSNREPYIHNRDAHGEIEVQVPASGLVTALEPVMRACSGTWIAHGSGSADRETVDHKDHVRVPPENPSYQIRRIWLTKEEEEGYYFGFANEGLWPLCHLAHTRPVFRSEDFEAYRKVNQRFAEAVCEEAKTENPVILVQDYHFALLPKMIRERLPRATIITFWHIPWPNAESFGICPWKEEILEGMLGSSILGFHTRFHCNNFLDAVDRYLEARINRDDSMVSYAGHLAAVRNYPISIDWPIRWAKSQQPVDTCRENIRKRHGLAPEIRLGVGVDRMDYTKGILERFAAVERLFELYPEWIGKFAFIQIAAPTRSTIPQYRHFAEELHILVERINQRYGTKNYRPIILLDRHHGPEQIFEYFRGSDFCFVSSLHDGMNLVAKEFVASRDDDNGVLILSQFTGAARELPEALIVNPYDSDQCADAINDALLMPLDQQSARMRNMRVFVQEYNVFRWAGRMLLDAARIRQRSMVLGR